ncbi:hypothetical protein DCO58_02920 [Helicobacter saguini]|uniref:Dynamin N-terminal domain-containing protein n=1 Tax=Helicobacter saguini TaxID=1548018 RepID=A0A347VS32_9HELI|nr:dynamin family protein [Helicobacter saguini]MWV62672.1 hypothetical protein [Helicobacter saguini]MWV66656.1 hypothetical protein [Helicobacter saguini]MWV69006.1 hypothetical protein [Helicobacter saguini]MWV71440.1 hypothetical protein [Helicobacter saguini]TLD94089.1 hypothetical protein LS64_007175 [Helicobacter saguini]
MDKHIKNLKALAKNISEYINSNEYLDKTTIVEIKEILDSINVAKSEYKIAIVANMSAGKSTLINALFGKEILPAYTKSTTDCPTYIHNKDSKKLVVTKSNGEKIEVTQNIESEIKDYAKNDETFKNDIKDEKYKNVERIDLYYPFENIKNPFNSVEVIFIDTPGPNAKGEEYSQKHKNSTSEILRHTDMVLFLFDYNQLDSQIETNNTQNDKLGLWHAIKERIATKKAKDFEVFFIINKIDGALKDNRQNIKDILAKEHNKSKQELKALNNELEHKYFGKNEKEAKEKLENAAKTYGIENPKVLLVSSYYHLLKNTIESSFDDDAEQDLKGKREFFMRIFGDSWEREFIEYLGITSLEQEINKYIEHNVAEKILNRIKDSIKKSFELIKKNFNMQIGIYSKPKSKAAQNLQDAQSYLKQDMPQYKKDIQEYMQQEIYKAQGELADIIESRKQEYFGKEQVDSIAAGVGFFTIRYLDGYSKEDSKSAAKKAILENDVKKITSDIMNVKTSVSDDKKQECLNLVPEFLQEVMQDITNQFLFIENDIAMIFVDIYTECDITFMQYKSKIESHIGKTLEIENVNIDYKNIHIDIDDINIKMDIQETTDSYKVSDSTWYKPWTWGDERTITYKDGYKINLSIIRKEIQQNIENNIYPNINKIKQDSNKSIESLCDSYNNLFNTFILAQEAKIQNLKKELESSTHKLQDVEDAAAEFDKLQSQILSQMGE